jgi:hypothetical protein
MYEEVAWKHGGGQARPKISNPQIFRLIPQSNICQFPWCASPQIATSQISTNYCATLSQNSPLKQLLNCVQI